MNMNLKKWLEFIESDKDLSQKLLLKKLDYENSSKSYRQFVIEIFIPEAKKHGFDFSFTDIKDFAQETGIQELSIDDLEAVAGGRSKVLMNIGVVSMALITVLPVVNFFMNKNGMEGSANTAVVSTLQNEKDSGKEKGQDKENTSKNVQSSQINKIMDNNSANKR